MRPLRIGTRGSELARRQADFVCRAIRAAWPGAQVELEMIATAGDADAATPLHRLGGAGAFTSAIESAVAEGRVDLAVHSLKDLPGRVPDGLAIIAVPAREDPADALVARDGRGLANLPQGARVLAGSLRRRALLLHYRPDLRIEELRGNVPTRLARLTQSGADAAVLACAGLIRLDLAGRITERLDPATFVPACGQGALAVEIRADDAELAERLAPLDNPAVRAAVTAERTMLAELGAGCHAPVGGYARLAENARTLMLTGMVASPDGSTVVHRSDAAACGNDLGQAEALGRRVAEALRAGGAEEILRDMPPAARVHEGP